MREIDSMTELRDRMWGIGKSCSAEFSELRDAREAGAYVLRCGREVHLDDD